MDWQMRSSTLGATAREFPEFHFAEAKHSIIDNLVNLSPEGACRNSCLEVGVLAAGMTRRTRWGEAYQTLHSTDQRFVAGSTAHFPASAYPHCFVVHVDLTPS